MDFIKDFIKLIRATLVFLLLLTLWVIAIPAPICAVFASIGLCAHGKLHIVYPILSPVVGIVWAAFWLTVFTRVLDALDF